MKKFSLVLIILLALPLFLCSCSNKPSGIANTDQMPGKGAKKMMDRIKKDADIKAAKKADEEDKNEEDKHGKAKVPIKDVRVMSNGVLYYRDNTLTNLTGVNYIDPQTGATTTPSEPDFEQSKTPVQY